MGKKMSRLFSLLKSRLEIDKNLKKKKTILEFSDAPFIVLTLLHEKMLGGKNRKIIWDCSANDSQQVCTKSAPLPTHSRQPQLWSVDFIISTSTSCTTTCPCRGLNTLKGVCTIRLRSSSVSFSDCQLAEFCQQLWSEVTRRKCRHENGCVIPFSKAFVD